MISLLFLLHASLEVKLFTINFDIKRKQPLYQQLYHYIKIEIENGRWKEGEKLPSKRKLAAHLQISQFTVENAYGQLAAEGYIISIPKKGYYVGSVGVIIHKSTPLIQIDDFQENVTQYEYNLKTNVVDTQSFPYSVWSKLMRACMREESETLLHSIHPQGDIRLRTEIANYLREFREMTVAPQQIIVGAGIEYLFGMLTELLSGQAVGIENPGYMKIVKILQSRGIKWHAIPVDKEGMQVDFLKLTNASYALITPAHHFPLGTVMSIGRRKQLLQWAGTHNKRYLIEDDYDSEFRFARKPIPTLYSLDSQERVIYLNTFAKTLTPSLRIAYMVLPRELLAKYRKNLLFYSCSVSAFEQLTLQAFLKQGHYEQHLNRMRLIYKNRRDTFIKSMAPLANRMSIEGHEAGMHLLLHFHDNTSEKTLVDQAAKHSVAVYPLSDYYFDSCPKETNTVIVGYGGYSEDNLVAVANKLVVAWLK